MVMPNYFFSTIEYITHLPLKIGQYSTLYVFLYHYVKPQELYIMI